MTTTKLFIKYIVQVSIVLGTIAFSFYNQMSCMLYESIPGINWLYLRLMAMDNCYYIIFGVLGVIWLLLVGIKAYKLYMPAIGQDLDAEKMKMDKVAK